MMIREGACGKKRGAGKRAIGGARGVIFSGTAPEFEIDRAAGKSRRSTPGRPSQARNREAIDGSGYSCGWGE